MTLVGTAVDARPSPGAAALVQPTSRWLRSPLSVDEPADAPNPEDFYRDLGGEG